MLCNNRTVLKSLRSLEKNWSVSYNRVSTGSMNVNGFRDKVIQARLCESLKKKKKRKEKCYPKLVQVLGKGTVRCRRVLYVGVTGAIYSYPK
jgi:hypothetical protein